MSGSIELRFHIHAFTKATIPMARLAEYLLDLAEILGEPHSVHFDRLEDGSAVPVLKIDEEAEPKIIRNVQRAQTSQAPKHVREARFRMEQRLAEDNAKGAEVIDQTRGFKLLQFKGRDAIHEPWGPIRQAGELTGVVTSIGGRKEFISVRFQDGEHTYTCRAKRDIGRQLRAFLLEDKPIRVHGYGRWTRNDLGEWQLDEFTIAEFSSLDSTPMKEVLEDLRSVKSEWLEGSDPIGELDKLKDT
jgi:hypothetical protein